MNVTFQTNDLSNAFKAVRSIFSKGPSAEKDDNNQDCLVASKEDGSVILESANAGLYLQYRLDAEVAEGGRVVINRDYVAGLKFRSSETSFKFKDGAAKMGFKSGDFNGKASVTQNFDNIKSGRPLKIPDAITAVPAGILRSGIKRVMFVSNDQESPDLLLTIKFDKKRMILTANDSYRAAVFQTNLEHEVTAPEIVIPAAFIASVVNAMAPDADVAIGTNDNVIRIVGSGIDLCHPVLQDVKKVDIEANIKGIEKSACNCEFVVDVQEAKEAIDSAASIVPSSLNAHVKMDMEVNENGTIGVKVDSAMGTSANKFSSESVTVTKETPIKIDSRYILEFLSLFGDDKAIIRVWDRPVIMRSEKYGTTLVMPQLTA